MTSSTDQITDVSHIDENSIVEIAAATSTNNDDWISYLDDATGQEYWYNVVTGQTSWA